MVISCINKHKTVLLIVGLTLLFLVTACTPDAVAPVKHKVTYIGFAGDVIEVDNLSELAALDKRYQNIQ